jgi:uncharacterized protein YndB with AHSA1/START domain
MNATSEQAAHAEAEELVLTRVLDAPRALVWRAWTVSKHFSKWFGPPTIAITDCAIDPRPGGTIRFTHQATDGSGLKVEILGTFDEVIPQQRLAIRFGFVDGGGRPAAHPLVPDWPLHARLLTVVTLADRNGKTELTVRQRVVPAEAAASAGVQNERKLAREGWQLTLDRLDALMEAEAGRG